MESPFASATLKLAALTSRWLGGSRQHTPDSWQIMHLLHVNRRLCAVLARLLWKGDRAACLSGKRHCFLPSVRAVGSVNWLLTGAVGGGKGWGGKEISGAAAVHCGCKRETPNARKTYSCPYNQLNVSRMSFSWASRFASCLVSCVYTYHYIGQGNPSRGNYRGVAGWRPLVGFK